MTRFLIIDDHPLFREALGNAVRSALPDAVIFEAMSIDEALQVLASEPGIELALLDLSLPDATRPSSRSARSTCRFRKAARASRRTAPNCNTD
jgi:DNA-binding NarL/FixJ family response regulator